jgi:hypothetical protein
MKPVAQHGTGSGLWSTVAFGTVVCLQHVDGEATTRHKGEILTGDVYTAEAQTG